MEEQKSTGSEKKKLNALYWIIAVIALLLVISGVMHWVGHKEKQELQATRNILQAGADRRRTGS